MSQWPDGERRQDYIETLITLKADVGHIKNSLENLNQTLQRYEGVQTHVDSCRNDVRWLKWTDRGIIAWLASLTWWIIKKI